MGPGGCHACDCRLFCTLASYSTVTEMKALGVAMLVSVVVFVKCSGMCRVEFRMECGERKVER